MSLESELLRLRLATLGIVAMLTVLVSGCDVASQIMGQSKAIGGSVAIGEGTGRIAFVSTREGNDEIYIMNSDGSQAMNLSNNPASDTLPAWSPDGARIAFQSNRDGNNEIYVMNANGSYQVRLTNHWATDEYPAWSPDGNRIAFASKRDGDYQVYVMNADGSNVTRLTELTALNDSPNWSPDGRQIVFVSERDGNKEIYVMNSDGTQPTRLTNNNAIDWFPKWTPDGKRIGFVSYRDGNLEIYAMNADGSQPTRLTNTAGRDFPPVWSPDGSQILFNSERNGNFEIYLMKSDGSMQTRLTTHPANDTFPVWQPREPSGEALKTPWVAQVTAAPTPTVTLTPTPIPLTPFPSESLTQTTNISGTWDSNNGKVTMQLWQTSVNRNIVVTGSWTQSDGNKGSLNSGIYNPQAGTLELSYYQPWNKVNGTARFNLISDGKTLKGTWKQGDQQGEWTMQRTFASATPTVPATGTPITPSRLSATAAPTVRAATPVPTNRVPSTATSTATAVVAPGFYANVVRTDPRAPHSGDPITFSVTFLNATGGTIYQKWFVKIFEPDKKNSFGETTKINSTIPNGNVTLNTGNDWHTGVGVCTNCIARVFSVDSVGTIAEVTESDGGSTATAFSICP